MSMILATTATALVTASLTLSPMNGGTAHHPQGHRAAVKVELNGETAALTGFEIWWGRGIALHRRGVPACSMATLAKGGPDACPRKSIMGHATGSADVDTVEPLPKFAWINGTAGRLIPYATLQRPARVRSPLHTTVVQGARGPWPNRDAWSFPRVFQQVGGIPVTMRRFTTTFGGMSWAKNYISTTGCPKGGWAYTIRLRTRDTTTGIADVIDVAGRAPCRR
jgi:hypothetical protein